jgi:hypothetical protein
MTNDMKNKISILEMQPEDILTPSWHEEYESRISKLWWEFVTLNSQIYVMEELQKFPFDLLFPPPPPNHFWTLIERSLLESSLMIIWRVVVDQGAKLLTINNLKDDILKNLRSKNFVDGFTEILKSKNYDERLQSFKKQVEKIRNNYLAHLNREKLLNPNDQDIKDRGIKLNTLREFRDTLNDFLSILCFGHGRAVLPLEYDPNIIPSKGMNRTTDVQEILVNMACRSSILLFPENNPFGWKAYKEKLSQENLDIINSWRKKCGLPPA